MRGKRGLAGLLAAGMLMGPPAPALAAGDGGLTRGAVCGILVQAADDYHPGLSAGDVMRGDGSGELSPDRPATRAEALVMLSRAFGPLPAPVGDAARRACPSSAFTHVPAWAQEALSGVFDAGIVAGTGASSLSPGAPVSAKELDTLIRRVYALEGSNLKDDFYAAVNKDWLDSSFLPAGYACSGTLYDLSYRVNGQVAGIIGEIAAGSPRAGTAEEKIKNLYENILDWDARNAAGTDPIRSYLDGIDKASSLDELMQVHVKISGDLALSTLLGFGLSVDSKNSTRYLLTFASLSPSLPKETYAAGGDCVQAAYRAYLTTLLILGGEDETSAARDAGLIYGLERELSAAMIDRQDYGDVDKTYHLYTMEQLQTLFPHVALDKVLSTAGFAPSGHILVDDPGLLKAAAARFDEAHLDTLKAVAKAGVLLSLGGTLSRDFLEAANRFRQVLYGTDTAVPDEQMAAQAVQSYLPDYLGQIYVRRCFPAKAKADVTAMIEEFRTIYKGRIEALDWMSSATRVKAVEKLDAMAVNVGYPDKWSTDLDAAKIKSAAQGGSYLDNVLALSRAGRAAAVRLQNQPVDKTRWQMSAYTVNAYYDPTSNSINFPAGILQAPLYDVSADSTENLGGIGSIIAHEMTHAFDNNGAKYDASGNAADWWTKEDYAAFQALCGRAVAFYDGLEAAPGIACSGALTLSENIADLGAAACLVQAEGRENTPDYQTLFTTMARTWRFTATREIRSHLAQTDVHAPDNLRGSRVLQSCGAFYTAFGIHPGDGMYLAPEDRVQIW